MTPATEDAIREALGWLGPRLSASAPIGPSTTYRVGGPARFRVEILDADDLLHLAASLVRVVALVGPVPILVIGKGSNLLVSDSGFDGVVVVLGEEFADVTVDGTTVRAGAAASLPVVARRTVAAGLTGFEWAVGVPGSIGGAVRMNAGGHGSDLARSLRSIRFVDLGTGEDGEMAASALDLGYRSSAVRDAMVVTEATLDLAVGDVAEGQATLSEIVGWRRENQPGGQNAGSVFTNPAGDSAGRLIEAAGCKGRRIGTAEISTKHANFIQSDPGGSADDVFALMVDVARRVLDHTGTVLHPETRMIGFPPFDEAVRRRGSGSS